MSAGSVWVACLDGYLQQDVTSHDGEESVHIALPSEQIAERHRAGLPEGVR